MRQIKVPYLKPVDPRLSYVIGRAVMAAEMMSDCESPKRNFVTTTSSRKRSRNTAAANTTTET